MHHLATTLGTRLWSLALLGSFLPKECEFPHPPIGSGGAAGASMGGAVSGGNAGHGHGNFAGVSAGGTANAGVAGFVGTSGSTSKGGSTSIGGDAGTAGVAAGNVDPVVGCSAPEWPSRATFELLPMRDPEPLPEGNVVQAQLALSANGNVIAGSSVIRRADGTFAWAPTLWTNGTIEILSEGFGTVDALDCDGSSAIGYAGAPFWWNRDGSIEFIVGGRPTLLSADGTLGVGLDAGDNLLTRWEPAPRPLGPTGFAPTDMTADAGTIFGQSFTYCSEPGALCPVDVLRWNASTGVTSLFDSLGYVVASTDGTTVAAVPWRPPYDDTGHYGWVVLWNEAEGLRQLTCPITPCFPRALSSRGHVLLTQGTEPLVWSQRHGFRRLVELLDAYGASTVGYQLDVWSMSDDARVFTGMVWINDANRAVAYRATLPRAAWE